MASSLVKRARDFCGEYALQIPILMAPMAGACPPSLASAVANAGGMGGCGVLLMVPDQINSWVKTFRQQSNGSFQLNLWIPDPKPRRDPQQEAEVRQFLGRWGPAPAADVDPAVLDFEAQCHSMLEAGPRAISSIMGLYPDWVIEEMKSRGISWFATATTVKEAVAAENAGADVIIAQGMEAGGHRGAFQAENAETTMVGLMSLLPAIVDAVKLPVIAAGGIGDGRGVAAALILGASAVIVGTAFLRSPEAQIPQAWSDELGAAWPEDTVTTRAFSGRLGRSLRTDFADAWRASDAPAPAPYPVQRALTKAMREAAARENDIQRMQAWAGQSARLAPAAPAGEIARQMWADAEAVLGA